MSETDAEFVERLMKGWARHEEVWSGDASRLFALARRGAAMQWRPIEEAPKDGTPIRLWRPAAEGGKWQQEVTAIWDCECGEWAWPDDPVIDIFGPRDWLDEGDCYTSKAFTHWQPLPLPPPPKGAEA